MTKEQERTELHRELRTAIDEIVDGIYPIR